MTDTHSIAQPFEAEVSPANNRHVTVGYVSRYPDHAHIPALTLKASVAGSRRFCDRHGGRCQSDGRLYCPHHPTTRRRRERTDAVAAPGMQAVGA